jgi:RecA-family ATPase
VGKSWFTLLLAIAVALNRSLWGRFRIERPGRVLYCGLEETTARSTSRLKKLIPTPEPALQNIQFIYHLRPLLAGGATDLDTYLTANQCELVVIDTLSAIVQAGGKRDIFRSDYNEAATLRQLAEKHSTAILVVTHLRKMASDSIVDAIAGTTGLTAACDAIWGLRRQPDGSSLLEVTGRELEEKAYGLRFEANPEGFGWNLAGEGSNMKLSAERKEIIDLLREGGPQEPKAVANLLHKNPSTTRVLLRKMAEDGDLVKGTDRKHRIVDERHVTP